MSFAFLNISSNIEASINTSKFGGQGCPPYDTREEALKNAEEKGIEKIGITQSGRKIYMDKKTGDLYSLDELHNTWEHIDSKGRHLGEMSSDFERLIDTADTTGKHNVDKKELQKLLNQKLK